CLLLSCGCSLFEERGVLGSLQQSSEVEVEIAWIGAQGFLRGSSAHARGLQIFEQVFVKSGCKALKPSAYGSLVHMEHARDFHQCPLVQEPCRKKEPFLRW